MQIDKDVTDAIPDPCYIVDTYYRLKVDKLHVLESEKRNSFLTHVTVGVFLKHVR